jgi:hypothetical protein
MQRAVSALCVLPLAIACRSGSGSCGLLPQHSASAPEVRDRTPRTGSTLAAKYGRSLRVAHATAIGALRGVHWSDDEQRVAVWSESATLVFDMPTERLLTRVALPPGDAIDGASLSADGRWVAVARRSASESTLELFAVGEASPKRRFTPGVTSTGAWWQLARDGRTVVWLEATGAKPKAGLRLRVDTVDAAASRLALDLPTLEAQEVHGLELGSSGKLVVVRQGDRVSFVDVAAGRAWVYAALSEPSLAANGEAVAWASGEGWLLRTLRQEQPVSLVDARCSPRSWPALAATNALFSEDGRTLATSGATGVCLWDLERKRLRTVLSSQAQKDDGDMPRSPDAWVLAGKGLIIRGTELWDVEHRRLVKIGFGDWSAQGPEPLLLDVSVEVDQPARLWSVDADFAVHEIAHGDCVVDRYSERPTVLRLGDAAAIACQPDPWIVDLRTRQTRRIVGQNAAELGRSPQGRWLTLQTEKRTTFVVADPSRPGSEHAFVSALGAGRLASYEDRRIGLLDWPHAQRFDWTTVVFEDPRKVRLERGSSTQRCANGNSYPIGTHFAWSRADGSPLVLCDLTTGREVGALDDPGRAKLMALNSDASLAVVGDPRGRFWFPREKKTVDLNATVYRPVFAGPHTVVGVSEGKVVTAEPSKGAPTDGWELSISDGDLLAADLSSDLVVVGGEQPRLRRLGTGQVVAQLPVRRLQTAAFGPNGRLAASDGQRIWLWHLPSPQPVGELVIGKEGVLFIAENGRFETSDAVAHWESALFCSAGPERLPTATCIDGLYERGLLGRALGGGDGAGPHR